MKRPSDSQTSASLLGRLHRNPSDPAAWDEFVERYGRRIYLWCRGWRLQDADARDVAQNVLLEIAKKMHTFQYDPTRSFRAWLKTLTRAAWCDFVAHQAKRPRGSGDSTVFELLQAHAAPDELAQQVEEQYDAELLQAATVRVRLRVKPDTWEAFRSLVYAEQSGADTAARLGMSVAAVYRAKFRVQQMLQDEIRQLDDGQEAAP